MEQLKQLSKEYEKLRNLAHEKQEAYFEEHDGDDFFEDVRAGEQPDFRNWEEKADAMIPAFIKAARKYARTHKLTDKELVSTLSEEITRSSPSSINPFLLIHLMWELGQKEEGNFDLESLEKLIANLLQPISISSVDDYYIESLIDIWHYDTEQPIPMHILENILLKDIPHYGALIKASSYLYNHPAEEVQQLLDKARKSKRYREDDYYRQWVS